MPFLNEMMYAHHFVIFLLFKKKSFNTKGSRLAALLHVDKKYLSWHKWRVSYVSCMPININTCRTFKEWKLDMDFGKIQLLLKTDEIYGTIC